MVVLDDNGFSMIEGLVSILLVGLILGLSFIILNNLAGSPKLIKRGEAFNLSNQEIQYCKNDTGIEDTSYTINGLTVTRSITDRNSFNEFIIRVKCKSNDKTLVELSIKTLK